MDLGLDGKLCVVTGASRGIGLAAARMLAEEGARVLRVSRGADGEGALALCEQHPGPIHLLVSDVVMPGMGARELAERLSTLRPQLRSLFISGYPSDAIGRYEDVLARGGAFLEKPYTSAARTRKVREVLDAPEEREPAGGRLTA